VTAASSDPKANEGGPPRRQVDAVKAALAWAATFAWIALITAFSGEGFSDASTSRFIGPLVRWLFPDVSPAMLAAIHFVVRKTAHAVEYGVLALLAWLALRRSFRLSPRRSAVLALAIVSAVGIADEAHQMRLATRTGSPLDVMLDLAGGALALSILFSWRRRAGGSPAPPAASSR
jgi:VanZ family protein